MTDIKLYTNSQSRGRIAHWMLEEIAEPYEVEWIAYGEQMKGAGYLAINPMGKVPAIVHHGNIVTEAAAICTYLAASFPEKNLIPAVGSPELADFYRWMFFAAGPMEMATTASSFGWSVKKDQERMAGYGNIDHTLNALELALSEGPYICGDKFTAADIYLGSGLFWGMLFGSIEKRNAFSEYSKLLSARPAYIQANQINENHDNHDNSES
jgi:glutathione S-transferase